jgi:hypothetical protein
MQESFFEVNRSAKIVRLTVRRGFAVPGGVGWLRSRWGLI